MSLLSISSLVIFKDVNLLENPRSRKEQGASCNILLKKYSLAHLNPSSWKPSSRPAGEKSGISCEGTHSKKETASTRKHPGPFPLLRTQLNQEWLGDTHHC